ncbi:MAG: LCP family protein [Beduini sp.]|uniref:LCP family protein n=2 Tax=Beduini sp. TaxID=1922300 RepID=UPI0011C863F4
MRKIFAIVLSAIFIGITGFSSWQLYQYEGFTTGFRYTFIIILVVLCALVFIRFWSTQLRAVKRKMPLKEKNRIKRKRLSSICLMLALCIALTYVNHLYYNIDKTMDSITDVDLTEEILVCNVYALKESNITSLSSKDIDYFGTLSCEDGSIKMPLSNILKKDYNKTSSTHTIVSYPTAVDLYIGLAEKDVDVIVVSEKETETMKKYNEDFTQKTTLVCQLSLSSSATSDPVNVASEPFNVLIMGVDIREEEGTIKTDSRTDTLMVASFNPKTMKISLISIPRDSYVSINGGQKDKITHAGMSGIPSVINTVEELLDININYFAKFNFNALVKIIDAIGGINIHVDYGFCEQDSNDVPDAICLEEGQQNLNGEQALAYARHRKTVTDHIRNNAQQQVIQGITNKLTSFSVVTNFNSILKVLSSNMLTNFTKKELYTLAGLAPNFGNLSYQNLIISGEDDITYLPQYGEELYVTYLDATSITEAKNLIEQIHKGQ